MTPFEASMERIADRALAKKRAIALIPPVATVKPIIGCKSTRRVVVVAAMGSRWMTARAVARKTNLRVEQVQELFYRIENRGKFEKRSLHCRNHGFEWRVAGLKHPRPKKSAAE